MKMNFEQALAAMRAGKKVKCLDYNMYPLCYKDGKVHCVPIEGEPYVCDVIQTKCILGDWEVIEDIPEKNKEMSWEESKQQMMINGKKIRRPEWGKGIYLECAIINGEKNIRKVNLNDIYYPTGWEVDRVKDWEVVSDIPEAKMIEKSKPVYEVLKSIGWKPLDFKVNLSDVKVNPALQPGWMYLVNNIDPMTTEINFAKLKDEPKKENKLIERYKKWLQNNIDNSKSDAKESADEGNYQMAHEFSLNCDVFLDCLMVLNKFEKEGD
jgi:hypothetical protein